MSTHPKRSLESEGEEKGAAAKTSSSDTRYASSSTKRQKGDAEASSTLHNHGGKGGPKEQPLEQDYDIPPPKKTLRPLILHVVECSRTQVEGQDHSSHPISVSYLDEPRLFANDNRSSFLRGIRPLAYLNEYLRIHPEICLVVSKQYSCTEYHAAHRGEFAKSAPENIEHATFLHYQPWFFTLPHDLGTGTVNAEYLRACGDLADALDKLEDPLKKVTPSWSRESDMVYPYDYFFHHLQKFQDLASKHLSGTLRRAVDILLNYLQNAHGQEFADIRRRLQDGFVSTKSFSKLFLLEEPAVMMVDGKLNAYMVEDIDRYRTEIDLTCWSWKFDGQFTKNRTEIHVSMPDEYMSSEKNREVSVRSLKAWPLRLETDEVRNYLQARGQKVWQCRKQRLVGYEAPQATSFDLQISDPRFMIDFGMYEYLHRDGPGKTRVNVHEDVSDDSTEAIDVEATEPPDGHFLSLLPATILGYGFHDKRWRTLQVDNIRDVEWNKTAFNRLVLKSQKKRLIEALITIHLASTESSDVISNKGNGLILLLHGPPGTGKTLTAESVAELTEKPLYRITCGDIGTNAEAVEKYLESALYIGTIWGCVVLLDEADVFLEERTSNNLDRNALVSVFLRVLEYYRGILILTSNRVGIFDEAFTSRVQLAVRYPALDESGRFEIWMNFFSALDDTSGSEVDFKELRRKVDILARQNMNGRQIRNAIKSARQLAMFCKETLQYKHLEEVIDVAKEFEDYLRGFRGDEEEWAREQGTR
ncbi:hypothetical protein FOPE_06674 [Fonsecaea pedrosoi]|nr:hypothetical protein FOPE_06674 [Fonsecaea pedrosoi]